MKLFGTRLFVVIAGLSMGLATLSAAPHAARAHVPGERDVEVSLAGDAVVVRVRAGVREVIANKPAPPGDAFAREDLEPLVAAYGASLARDLGVVLDEDPVALTVKDTALESRGDRKVRSADLDRTHVDIELRGRMLREPSAVKVTLPAGDPSAKDVVTLRREGQPDALSMEAGTPGKTVTLLLAPRDPSGLDSSPTPPPSVGDRPRPFPTYYAVPVVLVGAILFAWWFATRRPLGDRS